MAAAVDDISKGRLGLEIEGEEHAAMVSIIKGIEEATAIYNEVIDSGNIEFMIIADYTFTRAEAEHGEVDEKRPQASAKAALQNYDDALLVLPIVEKPELYQAVDKAFSHFGKPWRYNGLPCDAFHVMCNGHKTRLNNALSRFGISRRERALTALRIKMIDKAQDVYVEKQREALKTTHEN
jgi:hypothetical protein